jgi:hypothetical protein
MADSADDLLRQAREALNDWITADAFSAAESMASGRLASAFEMLDALMSAGGPLPADWVPAADRTVTDIPGPDAPLTVKRLLNEPGLIQGIADPAIRETLDIRERPGGTGG